MATNPTLIERLRLWVHVAENNGPLAPMLYDLQAAITALSIPAPDVLALSAKWRAHEPEKFGAGYGTRHDARLECADELDALPSVPDVRIICLCGSTRFIDQFATATWTLELQGYIVLGCTLLPMWFCGVRSHFAEATGVKGQRDEHHLRKIDLADEVLVLNIGGYIGESTRNEIAYAEAHGKLIRYVDQEPELLAAIMPDTALAGGQQPSPPVADRMTTTVVRLEVIDEQGRRYSRRPCAVELSYQDDGRTLKVFVSPVDDAIKEQP